MDGDVLHFAAEGGVIAPEYGNSLFKNYSNCQEILFNGCFDTSQVTNMREMFFGCSSLTSLDLSSFRIAEDANVDDMLTGCDSLQPENIRGFASLPPKAGKAGISGRR